MSVLTSISYKIMSGSRHWHAKWNWVAPGLIRGCSIGLKLIVYQPVSVLTMITDEIVPVNLKLIVYELVSSWHRSLWDLAHWFGIDSLQASVCGDIDSWRDRAHWFGIVSLQGSVRLTSIADEIMSGFRHWHAKWNWVAPGLIRGWETLMEYAMY